MAGKNPSRQTLTNRVQPVASSILGTLNQIRQYVLLDMTPQLAVALKLSFQKRGIDAIGGARNLNERLPRHLSRPQKHGHPDDTVDADDADLDSGSVSQS